MHAFQHLHLHQPARRSSIHDIFLTTIEHTEARVAAYLGHASGWPETRMRPLVALAQFQNRELKNRALVDGKTQRCSFAAPPNPTSPAEAERQLASDPEFQKELASWMRH